MGDRLTEEDLTAPIPCPDCGTRMTELEWTADGAYEQGRHLSWSYTCPSCGREILDVDNRLTVDTHPGYAPLVAEIRALWAGRDKLLAGQADARRAS